MLPRYGAQVVRQRVTSSKDRYGDENRNFQGNNTESVTYRAHVQITGSSELVDEGRKGIQTTATFWFDPTADVRADDRLRWNNLLWQIDANPVLWNQIPGLDHLEVAAFTVRG